MANERMHKAVCRCPLSRNPIRIRNTHHGLEGDVAVLLERRLALLLRGRPVVRDVGHVALLLVTVVALDGAVVLGLPHLNEGRNE